MFTTTDTFTTAEEYKEVAELCFAKANELRPSATRNKWIDAAENFTYLSEKASNV